jgi:hypothetical protein
MLYVLRLFVFSVAAFAAFAAIASSMTHAEVHPQPVTERQADSKPLWIERGTVQVDDTLFVVGVASQVTTREEGRWKSLESAKDELDARSEKKWPDVETRDLYEEIEPDGTFTVWRLVSVKLVTTTTLSVADQMPKPTTEPLPRSKTRYDYFTLSLTEKLCRMHPEDDHYCDEAERQRKARAEWIATASPDKLVALLDHERQSQGQRPLSDQEKRNIETIRKLELGKQ